jgi:hypothetical protein
MKPSPRALAILLSAGILASVVPATASVVFDDFESYGLGTFPSPTWSDVATVDPTVLPITPIPSATVVSTTDAFGNPTQAVAFVPALGAAGGIFRSVPVSTQYGFGVDIRIDEFAANPANPTSDWAAQMGFVQNGLNYSFTPQIGIYASSLAQDWRLFAIGTNFGLDLPLGVPIVLGTWYRVDLDFNANTAIAHSVVTDILSGIVLVDRFDLVGDGVNDWTTGGVPLDSITIFDGELSATTPNLAVFDNLGTAATAPEPATILLLAFGLAGASVTLRKH